MPSIVYAVIVIVVVAAVVFRAGVRIVRPTHKGLVERLGKYRRFANPGYNWTCVRPRDLWIADRNFGTTGFMSGIDACVAAFIIRQRSTVHGEGASRFAYQGTISTGKVYEPSLGLRMAQGKMLPLPRGGWQEWGAGSLPRVAPAARPWAGGRSRCRGRSGPEVLDSVGEAVCQVTRPAPPTTARGSSPK